MSIANLFLSLVGVVATAAGFASARFNLCKRSTRFRMAVNAGFGLGGGGSGIEIIIYNDGRPLRLQSVRIHSSVPNVLARPRRANWRDLEIDSDRSCEFFINYNWTGAALFRMPWTLRVELDNGYCVDIPSQAVFGRYGIRVSSPWWNPLQPPQIVFDEYGRREANSYRCAFPHTLEPSVRHLIEA
jgi:hypothetical protein